MKLDTPVYPGQTERARFLLTLPGVLLVVAIYALVHASTRLLASGNLGEDDTFDNLLIQTLAPGYSADNGPLYDWLLWMLQQALGSGIQAFLLLKYTLLVTLAGCLFLITRRLTGSALWAFIAVESMATVYQIFWRFHEGFTHRVGAMVLVVATFWALLRLIDRAGWRDYLLFAVLLGLGLLSEHSYPAFLVALLIAASLQPGLRRRLFSARLLAVLPLTALIVSPYLQWLLAEPQRSAPLLAEVFPLLPVHSPAGLWHSLRDALTFPFLVLAPYIVIAPLVIPGLFKSVLRQTPLRPQANGQPDLSMLLSHLLLIEFAELVINNLLYSRYGYGVHSILPMFVIAIAWVTDKARQANPSPRRVRVFIGVLLAFTLTAYAVRCANLFIEEPFCSRCRWGIPYADLAKQLRQQGFSEGTLISNDERISGNLRRFFPTVAFPLPGRYAPLPEVADLPPGRLAILWASNAEPPELPPDLQLYAAIATPPRLIQAPWQHLWRPAGYRHSTWAAVIIDRPAAAAPTP